MQLAPANSHICQIIAKPTAALSIAITKPAPVFFGLTVRGLGFVPALFFTEHLDLEDASARGLTPISLDTLYEAKAYHAR